VLLQVLDDGHITDSQGRRVDFKNTILIMTSNIGSHLLLESMEAGGVIDEATEDAVMEQLRGCFRPEFLNRIDEIIMFRPLGRDSIAAIIDLQLSEINRLLEEKQVSIALTERAKEHIADAAYDPAYGARPLKRYLQKNVNTLAAKMILEGTLEPGQVITIDAERGKLVAK
jgi:ATP-dependent Clp protease ATP-binding subunit ClpB